MDAARGLRDLIGPASSTGSPMTFMMRPSVPVPTGTEIGCAGIARFLAADQAFGRIHCDRAHGGFAQMLRNLEHQTVALVIEFERIQDRRQMVLELHVDDGARNLRDASYDIRCCRHVQSPNS